MPTRIAYTDQQLLDYSEEHLLYELHIFPWVAENLPPEKGFPLSALLESFAIHLRNLIDFFYTPPNNARNDDLVAADFFDSPGVWDPGPISKSLSEARERANKEISHITYKRKTPADPTKPWPVADLFNEVQSIAVKFATGASGKKLHPKVATWLKSDTKTVAVLLASASTTTSNTAASIITGGAGGAASSSGKSSASLGTGGASTSATKTP
jgi:hypothetical protein